MALVRCDACGVEYGIGCSPWCKDRHEPVRLAVHPDDVPGGFWAENGFERPTWFPSHSAHEAALAARGLEIRAKWAGPHDRHLTRWDAPSAKTLEDARILLSRGRISAPDPEEPEYPITVTDIRGPWPEGVEHG